MTDTRQIGHEIATRAATQIVEEGIAAGLDWTDIAIACESAIAIIVAAAAEMSGRPDHNSRSNPHHQPEIRLG